MTPAEPESTRWMSSRVGQLPIDSLDFHLGRRDRLLTGTRQLLSAERYSSCRHSDPCPLTILECAHGNAATEAAATFIDIAFAQVKRQNVLSIAFLDAEVS